MNDILWQPDPERVAASSMQRLLRQRQADGHPAINDYPSLWRWSVTEPEAFWQTVADFCGISFATPAEQVLACG
ncbi:MAG: acetoacetate--CoA ligase, partial [Gammaproteobacteria bacterium]|nr:acetoacetate--CoA ligase [Gammaproteobacteria bacterium]